MNLRDLRYLVAVADHRHFGQAAEACFVSQPTLSTQLKKLERELGVELIERHPGHIMLTPAGEQVVERARVLLGEADDIVDIARRAKDPESGSLRIGLFPTLAPYLLPHVVPHLHARFPKLELLLVEEKTEVVHQRLREGRLDVGVLALPIHDDQLHDELLFAEDFVLAVPRDHPLAPVGRPRRHLGARRGERAAARGRATACASRPWPCASWPARPSAPASGRPASRRCARWWPPASASRCLPELAVQPPVAPSDDVVLLRFREPVPRRQIAMFWRRTSVYRDLLPDVAAIVRDTALPLVGHSAAA